MLLRNVSYWASRPFTSNCERQAATGLRHQDLAPSQLFEPLPVLVWRSVASRMLPPFHPILLAGREVAVVVVCRKILRTIASFPLSLTSCAWEVNCSIWPHPFVSCWKKKYKEWSCGYPVVLVDYSSEMKLIVVRIEKCCLGSIKTYLEEFLCKVR